MEALESAWLGERVLASDELLVVDKPVHIPVHGGGDEVGSVVERLAEYLTERGEPARLGVQHRLDQDTSGVLLFTRDPKLDREIALAFNQHGFSRVYLAVVDGTGLSDSGSMHCRLSALERGRVRVVSEGGKMARTHYRVRSRVGSRALVELRPETGRTHQLRVQLAQLGAPIVGDRLYGGAAAWRLMLHAHSLEVLGRRFEAELPPEFETALRQTEPRRSAQQLRARLRDAFNLRHSLTVQGDALRLVNGFGDGLPGIEIDHFSGWLVLALSTQDSEDRREEIVDLLMQLGAKGVYTKCRRRGDQRKVDRDQAAPAEPDSGVAALSPLWVQHGELRLPVWLDDGMSTGLFLDQRRNRAVLRRMAAGKAVLNLFCYTGAFSVAAAEGGARQITSVDLSGRALERARLSMAQTAPDLEARFIKEDVFHYLGHAKRQGERFDLIVLDPPSFGTRGRRRTFSVDKDYGRLAQQCLELLRPGGSLLAVTNHRKTSLGRLRRVLREAVAAAGRTHTQMKDARNGADFPDGPDGPEPSKSVWIRLA